jgi:hypothetical protein
MQTLRVLGVVLICAGVTLFATHDSLGRWALSSAPFFVMVGICSLLVGFSRTGRPKWNGSTRHDDGSSYVSYMTHGSHHSSHQSHCGHHGHDVGGAGHGGGDGGVGSDGGGGGGN